jgi:hypothetical protein
MKIDLYKGDCLIKPETSNSDIILIIEDKYLKYFDKHIEYRNEIVKIYNEFENYGNGEDYLQTICARKHIVKQKNIKVLGFTNEYKEVPVLSKCDYHGFFLTPSEVLKLFESEPRIWTDEDVENGYHSDDKKWIKNNIDNYHGKGIYDG